LFQNLFLFADFFHSSIELVAFLHLFIWILFEVIDYFLN
jgi:hypothetical protein